MLFRHDPGRTLAVSQPAHAFISGQILAAWHVQLDPLLVLAGEQHDIAWTDWELAPPFDPATGLPPLFRAVGASSHAPMWRRGVERALHAWGLLPALMISRHGGTIYRRFTDRHRVDPADADAAAGYLSAQAPVEAAWAGALGLDELTLARGSALIAFADTLSLAFCGELAVPLTIDAPDGRSVRVTALDGTATGPVYGLNRWPFAADTLTLRLNARLLPPAGRFDDAEAMRDWLADPAAHVSLPITARKLD